MDVAEAARTNGQLVSQKRGRERCALGACGSGFGLLEDGRMEPRITNGVMERKGREGWMGETGAQLRLCQGNDERAMQGWISADVGDLGQEGCLRRGTQQREPTEAHRR